MHQDLLLVEINLSTEVPEVRTYDSPFKRIAKEEEQTFENVVDPLLTEEYDVNYAFQTLILRMLTDWPLCSNREFESDMHHLKIMCARDQMEKLTDEGFQNAIK
uniref:Protein kinase domain-containing protein n=1 Tax=Ascaris lumbricoides TaxID=6252 RepID=A0A0M3HKD5_ASCLU